MARGTLKEHWSSFKLRHPHWGISHLSAGIFASIVAAIILASAAWLVRSQNQAPSVTSRKFIVAVAMPFTGPGQKTALQIWDAVTQARQDHCNIAPSTKASCNKALLDIVQSDDANDLKQAADNARRLNRSPSVIGVIGDLDSFVTESALHGYCADGNPLPLVMPVSTATILNVEAHNLGCSAVLRLPPTNLQQGERIARILQYMSDIDMLRDKSGNGAHSVTIFRDQTNPTYSNDLARELKYALHTSYARGQWKILLDQGVGGDAGGMMISQEMRRHSLGNIFVIAGMTEAVLQALSEANNIQWKRCITLLTDGAFSNYLVDNGSGILTRNTFLVFPSDTSQVAVQGLNQSLHLPLDEISYGPFGYDAAKLLFIAFDQMMRSGGVPKNRRTMEQIIASWLSSSGVGYGQNTFMFGDHYSFDSLGNNARPITTLYQYDERSHRFRPVPFNDMINP